MYFPHNSRIMRNPTFRVAWTSIVWKFTGSFGFMLLCRSNIIHLSQHPRPAPPSPPKWMAWPIVSWRAEPLVGLWIMFRNLHPMNVLTCIAQMPRLQHFPWCLNPQALSLPSEQSYILRAGSSLVNLFLSCSQCLYTKPVFFYTGTCPKQTWGLLSGETNACAIVLAYRPFKTDRKHASIDRNCNTSHL